MQQSPILSPLQVIAKRSIDVALSSFLLVVLGPLLLVIGMCVACSSRGGIFFRHPRIGLGGRVINVIKFRTMRGGSLERLVSNQSSFSDYVDAGFKLDRQSDEITAIGRLLRKSSLDELPQLWNVLVGEMSLVGIRPLIADELAVRPRNSQEKYLALRPGMTGLWQVSGRSLVSAAQRIALDDTYADSVSLRLDTKILVRTPLAILRWRQAY